MYDFRVFVNTTRAILRVTDALGKFSVIQKVQIYTRMYVLMAQLSRFALVRAMFQENSQNLLRKFGNQSVSNSYVATSSERNSDVSTATKLRKQCRE